MAFCFASPLKYKLLQSVLIRAARIVRFAGARSSASALATNISGEAGIWL
jgi:hypothetical protein